MPGTWAHLARRFFWTLGAPDLTAAEYDTLAEVLTAPQFELFCQQPGPDRRHGYQTMMAVSAATGDTEMLRAAALHDVGKRHAGLGVLGRSMASLLAKLRLPTPGRYGRYLDHGQIGADELAAVRSSALVVHFTKHHHGSRPDSVDEPTWNLLQAADGEVVGRSQAAR
ncbi:MAG: hypothetical protein ACLGHX_10405 [Acidimicrobiia bacterium]